MKKKIVITVVSVIAALAIIGGGTFAYASNVAKKNAISREKAISIAITDAGLKENEATVKRAHIDFEKGIFVYEIDFVTNNQIEYEYKIKASDGTILARDEEFDDDLPTKNNPSNDLGGTADNNPATDATVQNDATAKNPDQPSLPQTTAQLSGKISLEEAKSIALRDAGVAAKNANFTSAKKDYDDGVECYEIEFRASDYEYEYDIAMNGKIIFKDSERISRKPSGTTDNNVSAKFIGIDKAKSIALENASLTADQVRFTKAKLDRDDGMDLYEIEFVCKGIEYEYEIDARTGAVHSHSSEKND